MKTTYLLAIAATLMTGCAEQPPTPTEATASTIAFSDATASAGLAGFRNITGATGEQWFPETMGSGGAFFRLDNDGFDDIVLLAGGDWNAAARDTMAAVWIYRNAGDGTYRRVRDAVAESIDGYGFGVIAADYDNDGDHDLFVTTLGPDVLLRNDGGAFTDVTASAGLSADSGWSTAAAFFDADGDGWLDLFVGRYVDWTPETDIYCSQDGENKGYCTPELYQGLPARFYRSNGDGTFADHTQQAGFAASHGKTLGVVTLDHDRDGDPDLAVANDTEPDELWINQGDGSFVESGVVSGIAFDERGRARAGMGIAAGVVDQTGQETLFVGNFSSEMIGVFRHMGNDVFLDRAASSRIGRASLLTLTFGLTLADLDLDGDLDLFTANGHVQPHIERVKDNVRFRQPPHVFLNTGDGTFTDAAPDSGGPLAEAVVARGSAWSDIDGDGDIDMLLTRNGAAAMLLVNNTAGTGNWIRARLEGSRSNRDGIGARVSVWTSGSGVHRYVRTGGSYLSQSQLDPQVGLGTAASADSVVVKWPSGVVDRFTDVASGTTLSVIEGVAGQSGR